MAGKHAVQKKAVVRDPSIDRSGALLPDYTKGMLTGQSK
ncbi:hypothetical protein GGD68_002766 [Paraburkholderia fungorum]|uniref:Uncharacterized protein n=1 Tax=Paraburkholderia fungorum TaxID=134537 RepID=A0AAW3UUX9_9BURK|nr:hypothetical protein [Paraburkholderia fungorum]MBB6202457.1 hypothetical protein [Paraburkholderia fungorum]